ncbi:MerR family transcriptional regulator [Kluyvera genomosp. 1]|uniref:MerR family transcriptional regulator n=1 Tax=Kluyvera genomosp. 1 TaxID=2774053 RepID=UPI00069223A8|nr:MerR family transcriptional regulator [Kluyvera genomosp. 1]
MALYTIGEVAQLCDINPVTLRAWQRRYALLKPQRTDGGHRLFNDADIDRIREIQRWIETGVQVSKVKNLLCEQPDGWREQQEIALRDLRNGNLNHLRQWVKELRRTDSARTLVDNLFTPLRLRLQSAQLPLHTLLGLLDGVLINDIALSLSAARRKSGPQALVVGWNVTDLTRLWLEGWVACEQGWRVDVLAHSLSQIQPELFPGQTLLVWCGSAPNTLQQQQLARWQEDGAAFALPAN